ncbi:MAG TPA: L-threonine 3-dehydrogenase, partial [Tepidisphaeraceae bacterium]|nr:L-threonine 3-dehydrogenase [Tepidisphaeraceae bacterium]
MKALVKKHADVGLVLEDVPKPTIGINDVLIRVLKTGICGTDVHIYNWDDWARKTIPVPMVIGHEFVGEIVEVGENVNDFEVGDIVSGEGHVVCGRCRNCMAGRRHLCKQTKGIGVNRQGAFAEFVSLPMTNVWRHHDGVDLEVASIFDPFGNAVHTALQFDLLGEDVLITGAGPIGCMAAAVCRHAGARHIVVTDVNPYRLELATKLGASRVVDVRMEKLPDVQKSLGMAEGFDIGLEMSGNDRAFADMIANMAHGGRISMLGIPS